MQLQIFYQNQLQLNKHFKTILQALCESLQLDIGEIWTPESSNYQPIMLNV
jgi:hypothetical protein